MQHREVSLSPAAHLPLGAPASPHLASLLSLLVHLCLIPLPVIWRHLTDSFTFLHHLFLHLTLHQASTRVDHWFPCHFPVSLHSNRFVAGSVAHGTLALGDGGKLSGQPADADFLKLKSSPLLPRCRPLALTEVEVFFCRSCRGLQDSCSPQHCTIRQP